jgi:membrane fusion protein, multidrug efflux system
MRGLKSVWKKYRIRPFKHRNLIVFMALLVAVSNMGCQKSEKKLEARVVNVKVCTVESRSLRPFIGTIGTLKPYEEVVVSSEVDGIARKIMIDEGSVVSKGMLLAEINETDYRLEAGRAEAALRQTEASLANVKLEYERKAALYKEELVTKQQFDDVSARRAFAEGELDRARASLALAKEKLIKTKIYSPLQGFVKEKKVTTGDYVRNGTALLVVIQSDPIKLNFTVPEKEVGKLRIAQDVAFKVDSFPSQEFRGRIRNIYPNVEEKTRTLQVEALVPNRENRLKPGFFAKVTLFTEGAGDRLVIPATSILYDNERLKVFIAEGNVAKEKEVKIGGKYGELIEVMEGLKKGDVVVTAGQNNLAEGVKINVAR